MPSMTALKRYPHAIFLPPRFDVYHAVSRQIIQIFHTYTDVIEPLALDEAHLDVTENKLYQPSATLIAHQIRHQIQEQTGLVSEHAMDTQQIYTSRSLWDMDLEALS
jgi:DNA polymerase-4